MRTRDAEKYAAKWRADGHHGKDPNDTELRYAFAGCVRMPKDEELPAIREAILRHQPPALFCKVCRSSDPLTLAEAQEHAKRHGYPIGGSFSVAPVGGRTAGNGPTVYEGGYAP